MLALLRSLRRAARAAHAVVTAVPTQPRASSASARRRRRAIAPLEQIALDLGPERPRWRLSRLVERSPHRARVLEHVEFARRFFPELEALTIRIGFAQKPGVLGWGSMDPAQPGIWVRPRRLHLFTIAHEFTHLLQARQLVPRGERACDLFALARTPLLVDTPPSYLRVPHVLRRARLTLDQAHALNLLAREAVAARAAGDRRYLQRFERAAAERFA